MDLKLTVTNGGEDKLFSSLSRELERRLPLSTISWKRPMGKDMKTVSLSAAFERFKAADVHPSDSSEQQLYSQPFFHIFWTSCQENDEYKSRLKESIAAWLGKLRDAYIIDWLIVHVVYQDPAVKSNKAKLLLPRSSVYDKIRTDFCAKSQERCLQLWEPDKETLFTKSRESWNCLVLQLQQLLLSSFDRRLLEFESHLRKMLEGHTKPNWSFEKYFMLREELALTMKSIRLYEDALMHYDELNAVFSQSIINFCQSKGQPSWLFRYTQPCSSWMGLSLNKTVIQKYHHRINTGTASLLDVRNYLFVRICKLILPMKRVWLIGPRLLEYLFSVVHELRMLKVDSPPGGVALWVVSSCLNVLPVLTHKDMTCDAETNIALAGIYDYARIKLGEIGKLCALMPQTIVDEMATERRAILLTYLKLPDCSEEEENLNACLIMNEALSSKEKFQKLYLDISNKAIELYKEAGRHRFAMVIATNLSKFYLQCGDFDVAEKFLEEALDVYQQQGWEQLYIDVLVPLANCLEKHQLHDRYLVALAPLSSAVASLSEADRTVYARQFLALARSADLKERHTINSDPLLSIVDVNIDLLKEIGHIGDTVNVELHICNNLPIDVRCDVVSIGLRYSSTGERRNTDDDTFYKTLRSNSDIIDADDLPIVFQKQQPQEERDASRTSNLMSRLKSKLQSNSVSRADSPSKTRHSRTRSQPANLNAKVLAEIRKDIEQDAVHHHRSNSVDLHKNDETDGAKITKMASDSELCRSNSSARDFDDIAALEQYHIIPSPTVKSSPTPDENSPKERPRLRSHTSFHSLPEIELEPDPILSKNLTANDITLAPGLNIVTVSDKIKHEGRYALQALCCQVGRVQLYHLLVLTRRSKAFFIVNDPPKFKWTPSHNDCYLAGNVQRLHFTMSNGPGVIPDDAVVRVCSTSRLLFCDIPPSSVMVSSHVKSEMPREGVLSVTGVANSCGANTSAVVRLPACQPYETIQMFADVVAPVNDVVFTSNMAKHKLLFQCDWLTPFNVAGAVLPCAFYEPFAITHQLLCSGVRRFVQVTLQGLNPIQLQFDSPALHCMEQPNLCFRLLCDHADMHLYAGEEFSFVFEMIPSPESRDAVVAGEDVVPSSLMSCSFSIKFKTKDQEDFGQSSYTHTITLRNVQALILIETIMTSPSGEEGIVETTEGCATPIRFVVTYIGPDMTDRPMEVLCLLEDSNHWRFKDDDRSRTVVLDRANGACVVIDTDVVANVVGLLELPTLHLLSLHAQQQQQQQQPAVNGIEDSVDAGPVSIDDGAVPPPRRGLKRKDRLSSSRRTASATSSEDTKEFADDEIVSLDIGKTIRVVDGPRTSYTEAIPAT